MELRPWIWPALLAVTIFVASSSSHVAGPNLVGADKVEHFFIYGLLATLIARVPAVAGSRPFGLGLAVVIASVYGVTDEFHQSFTPGRSVEVLDWLSDTSGAALAVAVYAGWFQYRSFLERPLKPTRSGLLEKSESLS